MPETPRHSLKVFLCHASQDKPIVRDLAQRLFAEGWIDPWLDEKKLLPGEDWRSKIEEAVETSDIVLICLSNNSVGKEGFIQKELRYAREIALEKPDETIFLIPLRLDDCALPRGLRFFQWGDYFGEKKDETYTALLQAFELRYQQKLMLEEKNRARQEIERLEREAAANVAREMAELKKAEKAEQEKMERMAAERARKEKAELQDAEKAAQEKAKREAAEKAKREKIERRAAQTIALQLFFSKFFASFKLVVSKINPFLKIGGILAIILALFWVGSAALSQFPSSLPTVQASITAGPTSTFILSGSSVPFTKTVMVGSVTNTLTPTITDAPSSTSTTACTSAPGEVTTEFVWLRTGPGVNYRALAIYDKGVTVTILGKSQDGIWLVVSFPDGKQGWVSTSSIQTNASACNLPVATTPPTQTALPTPDLNNPLDPCTRYHRLYSRMQQAFGTSSGDPGYDSGADLNGDGHIDILDFGVLSSRWPENCPSP